MNVHHVIKGPLLKIIFIVTPLAAHAATKAEGLGAGRLLPTLAAVLGLIGIIIGARARKRNSEGSAIAAGLLGVLSLASGVLHAANSAGGFGTGNGLAGAIVAIALGLVSFIMAGFVLFRSRP